MAIVTPRIFLSYSRTDETAALQLAGELKRAGLDLWVDKEQIEIGDKLANIEAAVRESSLFIAYVTPDYLEKEWCRRELDLALGEPRIVVAPLADSESTLASLPRALLNDVSCQVLSESPEKRAATVAAIARQAWGSLQTSKYLVSPDNHILAGPEIFDQEEYSQASLLDRAKTELVLAGPNLRSWLTSAKTRQQLIDLLESTKVTVTFILATYETLRPVSAEGAVHLRSSVIGLREMRDALAPAGRERMQVYFHLGASTLSAVFVDPRSADGLLFFNPRWAIGFVPHDRLTCVIDKRYNSVGLYKALHNGVLLMIQGDALSLEQMDALGDPDLS
jgi:TIR domain